MLSLLWSTNPELKFEFKDILDLGVQAKFRPDLPMKPRTYFQTFSKFRIQIQPKQPDPGAQPCV